MKKKNVIEFLKQLKIFNFSITDRGWVQAHCPFARWTHKKGVDGNPSFGVKINDTGYSGYKCFSCQMSGSLRELTSALESFSGEKLPTVHRFIIEFENSNADTLSIDININEDEQPEPLDELYYGNIYSPILDYPEAMDYLIKRGVSSEATKILELQYDDKEHRIIFPVRGTDGKLYGYTGRSILPEASYTKGYPKVKDYLGLPKKHMVLGSHLVKNSNPIFVVEGLFGYASLISKGVTEIVNPVALLGANMTKAKADVLIQFAKATYLMLDNDDAGEKGIFGVWSGKKQIMEGAVDKLYGMVPIFIPEWMDGKVDPDELTLEDVKKIIGETPMYFK